MLSYSYEARRERMVRYQLERRGIEDERVLRAMREVPREAFVPAALRRRSYADEPLPFCRDQTISQPYVVAAMIEALRLRPSQRVLDVGAGSGYTSAVMSRIVERVHAVEIQEAPFQWARERLLRLGYDNVELRLGDGSLGWPEAAPFDAILVSASGPRVPRSLADQLAADGRMVIPVGPGPRDQRLRLVTHDPRGRLREEPLGAVRFVPLRGVEGWPAGVQRSGGPS